MTALAEQLRSQHHEAAAAAQIAMRSQRRVVRRTPMSLTPQESAPEPDERPDTQHVAMPAPQAPKPPSLNVVPIVPAEPPTPPSPTHTSVSPLDQPAEAFRLNLERRRQNREALIAWLKQALVEGVDYGSVHIVGKERCPLARQGRASECRDPSPPQQASTLQVGCRGHLFCAGAHRCVPQPPGLRTSHPGAARHPHHHAAM
jgi:hypothetical protein